MPADVAACPAGASGRCWRFRTTENGRRLSGAQQASARTVISHAHARDLAECWQDAGRDTHPVTRLARTGEITPDAEPTVAHDLRLLEMAAASWGTPPSIPEKQLRVLLDYIRHHGIRAPVEGWQHQRDAEFLRSIRRMASEARSQAPGDDGDREDVREMAVRRRRSGR